MAYFSNNCEGGADGVTVTVANSDDNSAGDAFGVVSGSPKYSTAWAAEGATSIKCEATSGNTSLIGFTFTDAMVSTRPAFRFPAAPSATCEIVQVRNAANGGAIQLRTDRKLNIVDDTGSIVHTTAAALSVDTDYELAISWKRGTTTSNGEIHFAYYLYGSDTPIATFDKTDANCGTTDWSGVRVGKLTGIASTETYFFDLLRVETGTVALLPPTVGLSAVTYTTERQVVVDTTGSVGVVTVTQLSGTAATIDDTEDPIFRITLPGHSDVLEFEVEADGDGDPVSSTFKVYPDSLVPILVYNGSEWE